jgi:DNA polymerase-3 subunit alpha
VIDKAVELIGDLDIATLPMDDKKTYEMLARGEATGVFQFESSGMREALRQVKPTEFEDLVALVALYRPGPMQYIPNYANRKHGTEPVAYLDLRLKPILGKTFGISIYQEQSMEIAKHIAGFSMFEAEDLRRAIGKKDHKLMASLKDKFIEGCIGNSTSDAVARQLWEDLEKAQDYSFNKAHAACYALISYRTAWLSAHHPCEYMAALISSVMSTKDRVPFYVNACHELGIEVLPPDVNESQVDFAVVGGKIRFGLNAVKGVGENACRASCPAFRPTLERNADLHPELAVCARQAGIKDRADHQHHERNRHHHCVFLHRVAYCTGAGSCVKKLPIFRNLEYRC